MSKKKIVKKVVKKNSFVETKSKSSWIWYALGAVVLLAVLFFVYKGITGNVITGNVIDDPILNSIWGGAKPVLQYLVGYDVYTGEDKFQDYFFMSLLILIIVFSIVFLVVKAMPFFNNDEHVWAVWSVSIAVSLLAVRFLTAEWLLTILLPYSTLGVVISAGLPFILFYFLVDKFSSDTQKKIAWIFFGIIFLYLYYDRTKKGSADAYYAIYLWTAVLAGIMALIGQKAVDKVKKKIKGEKNEKSAKLKRLRKKFDELHEQQQHYQHARDMFPVGSDQWKDQDAKHRKVTEELTKILAEISSLGG